MLDVGMAGLLAALALIFEWELLLPDGGNPKLTMAFGSVAAWRWQALAWWAASAAGLAVLPLRRRFPVIGFGVTLVMLTVHSLLAFGPSPIDFAVAIMVYTLASARPRRTSLGVLTLGAGLAVITDVAVAAAIRGPGPGQVAQPGADWLGKPAGALIPAVVAAAAWFAGDSAGARAGPTWPRPSAGHAMRSVTVTSGPSWPPRRNEPGSPGSCTTSSRTR